MDRSAALQSAANVLADAAAAARGWARGLAASVDRIGKDLKSLEEDSRRAENTARRIAAASGRRMCIGVFGPSQAGKSYLVSRLCQKPSQGDHDVEPLVADVGGQAMDFLLEINPAGERESTGLVTRFTTMPQQTPPGFPVSVLLLSELDIVRILANTFLFDLDPNNLQLDPPAPEQAETEAMLAEMRGKGAPALLAPHIEEGGIQDLKDYLAKKASTRLPFLEPTGYWDFAFETLNRLELRDRARVFRVLWGGIDELTDLYVTLTEGLDALSHAPEAFAVIEALLPRDRCIIDIEVMRNQLNTKADKADRVKVRGQCADGSAVTAELPRALLSALVAELRITMKNESWPLFADADVLDFPGARSREQHRSMRDGIVDEAALAKRPREMFIRGKVAVLFDRYSEERELTSMLLCMKGDTQEVKELASLISDWVHLTHGNLPQQRALQRNALFFVLTRTDEQFKWKAGLDKAAQSGVWSRRIGSSMRQPYQERGWLDNWDGGPFRNTFWMRNPSVEQAHLVAYRFETVGGQRQLIMPRCEIGPAADIAASLPEMKRNFLEDQDATKYFRDPEAAFDALLTLNDGGISYLVKNVADIVGPSIKQEQLQGRLLHQSQLLIDRFERYYDPGAAGAVSAKLRQTMSTFKSFGRCFSGENARNVGPFLQHLTAKVADLRAIYLNVASLEHEEGPAEADGSAVPNLESSIFDFGDGGAVPKTNTASRRDRAQVYAERAVRNWIRHLRDFAEDEANALHCGVGSHVVNQIVEEIATAASRTDAAGRIANVLRRLVSLTAPNRENDADLAAVTAASQLNRLLTDFGYGAVPPTARPPVPPEFTNKPTARLAFAPPESFKAMPVLQDKPVPLVETYLLDWLSSMAQLANDNFGHAGGRDISETDNAALGRILGKAAIGEQLRLGDGGT